VIAPDLPGYGQSGIPAPVSSIDDVASWLVRWLPGLADGPAVVMGHSMGGRVALQMALEHPDHVRALILVNASGLYLPETPARSPRDLGPEGFIRALYHRPSPRSLEAATRDAERWWPTLDRLTRTPLRRDWIDRLSEVRVPTLVIWGTEDGLIPWEHALAFQKGIPGAMLHPVPDAGHVPMLERPGEVNRAIVSFLATLASHTDPKGIPS
jgi:pimeloyl-ACP methyl ester carboxylesterase